MHEIGGAVQRVNDPAMGFVRTFNLTAFFHQKAVSGPRGLQLFADNAFGFQIPGFVTKSPGPFAIPAIFQFHRNHGAGHGRLFWRPRA
ncbi:MAG: hypothetical protein CM15mP21_7780 [Hyphomicrobiales bacterium]|nr:MAG: hypothetical protein CM15mP21_7780 [Hyphomicrobiales bacterium]